MENPPQERLPAASVDLSEAHDDASGQQRYVFSLRDIEDLIFSADLDGPEVVLRQSVVEWGTQLLDGSSGALTMEVIGVETVQTQDWLTGFWTADLENDGRVLTNINSTAVTEQGGNYTITGALEIYR